MDINPDKISAEQTIWRYMALWKFIHLLKYNALWFTRADELGDHLEGTVTQSEIKRRHEKWKTGGCREKLESGSELGRQVVYANCWSMMKNESYLLWKAYTPELVGVAIKSTIKRLSSCFMKCPHDLTEYQQLHFRKVKYIDYSEYKDCKEDNPYAPFRRFFHKEKAYRGERELRIFLLQQNTVDEQPSGKERSVDLDILIEEIYVLHKHESVIAFKETMETLMEKFGLDKNVKVSAIAQEALF